MAEVITSADGKLQILRHSIALATMGAKSVQGTIKNVGSNTVDAEIKVEFYDESGALLGPAAGKVKDLAPGEERIFDVWGHNLPDSWQVDTHKIISVDVVT